MSFLETIKKLINKVYRLDTFVKVLLSPIGNYLDRLYRIIIILRYNFFFDSLNEDGCTYFEKLLAITPRTGDSLENRQARIQAKWLSNNHNDIRLIQSVCDSWKNGEIAADFVDGKIQIQFIGEFGVPEDLNSLIDAINEIKPAHLPFMFLFRYLLIENIHEVKTIEDMENITLDMFTNGVEE